MKTQKPIPTKKKKIDILSPEFLAPFVMLFIIAGLWEGLSRGFKIPVTTFPPLSMIISQTAGSFVADIWPHMLVTLRTMFFGLLLGVPLGILLAAIFSQFRVTVYGVTPLALMLVVTPMITLVPLFMLWMGFDYEPRFIVVVVQSVPIVLLNTLTGFSVTPKKYLELMHGYGASKMQNFIKLIFPNALPQVFTGIKLGTVFSTTAAISIEMVAGNPGLGYRISYYSSQLQTPRVFGCIFIVAIIGITFFSIVNALEKRVITWSN